MQKKDFTKLAIEKQVQAMGCEIFDVGMLDMAYRNPKTGEVGERMELRTWSKETLLHDDTIKHLKLRNMRGQNIYIRPSGTHGLTLLDDLSGRAVDQMKATGFQPAAVVETSPNNFQAWVKHGTVLDQATSTAAARLCAEKFDGDPGSADWRHFGRLAGFTNRKPKYQQDNGHFPFVKLREATGIEYDRRSELLQQAHGVIEQERAAEQKRQEQYQQARSMAPARQDSKGFTEKTIQDFHADQRYGGDLTRADLAYATYAVSRGHQTHAIEAALAQRDLSHKGSPKRQQDYIDRKNKKAQERGISR